MWGRNNLCKLPCDLTDAGIVKIPSATLIAGWVDKMPPQLECENKAQTKLPSEYAKEMIARL